MSIEPENIQIPPAFYSDSGVYVLTYESVSRNQTYRYQYFFKKWENLAKMSYGITRFWGVINWEKKGKEENYYVCDHKFRNESVVIQPLYLAG